MRLIINSVNLRATFSNFLLFNFIRLLFGLYFTSLLQVDVLPSKAQKSVFSKYKVFCEKYTQGVEISLKTDREDFYLLTKHGITLPLESKASFKYISVTDVFLIG
jgi:hypothetical protein